MRQSAFCNFHLISIAPPAILKASPLLAIFLLLDLIFQTQCVVDTVVGIG